MTSTHLLILAGLGVEGRTLGPSMIRHVAKKHGYNVVVVNYIEQYPELLPQILEKYMDKNTILGVSTTYLPKKPTEGIRQLANTIKEFKKNKNFKILLGGPSAHTAKLLFSADYIINGYAEHSIIDFLNKQFNNNLYRTPHRWNINNSDHQWGTEDYIQKNETLPLEVGRGCIFKCKFCRFEYIGKRKGEYLRDLTLIKDELILNYENYNVTNYMIMDDTFNDDTEKLDNWNNMISLLPFKITYTAYLRADLLHRYQTVAKDLYSTGLRGGTFGIETLHPKASKIIGKAWSGKHAKDFMPKLINEIFHGKFLSKLNFIAGLPYETPKDIEQTMQWLIENKFYSASFLPLVIAPETEQNVTTSEFDREYIKYGYRINGVGDWVSEWMSRGDAVVMADKWFKENDTKFGGFQAYTKMPFVTYQTLLTKSKSEINNSVEYKENKSTFFKEYFNSLLG